MENNQGASASITVKALPTKRQGRPLLLGQTLDATVQWFISESTGFNLEIFVWGGMVSPCTMHREYLVTCICICQ